MEFVVLLPEDVDEADPEKQISTTGKNKYPQKGKTKRGALLTYIPYCHPVEQYIVNR